MVIIDNWRVYPSIGLFATAVVAMRCLRRSTEPASRGHGEPVWLGLAWLVVPFAPASGAFVEVGTMVAERLLYVPIVGPCLLVAPFLARGRGSRAGKEGETASGRGRLWLRRGLLCVLIGAMAARTLRRNVDWQDEVPPSVYDNMLHSPLPLNRSFD